MYITVHRKSSIDICILWSTKRAVQSCMCSPQQKYYKYMNIIVHRKSRKDTCRQSTERILQTCVHNPQKEQYRHVYTWSTERVAQTCVQYSPQKEQYRPMHMIVHRKSTIDTKRVLERIAQTYAQTTERVVWTRAQATSKYAVSWCYKYAHSPMIFFFSIGITRSQQKSSIKDITYVLSLML